MLVPSRYGEVSYLFSAFSLTASLVSSKSRTALSLTFAVQIGNDSGKAGKLSFLIWYRLRQSRGGINEERGFPVRSLVTKA